MKEFESENDSYGHETDEDIDESELGDDVLDPFEDKAGKTSESESASISDNDNESKE